MQEVKTTTKEVKDKSNMQWEAFDLGSATLHEDKQEKERYKQKVDELGLDGVKDFIESTDGQVVPFPKMTDAEKNVWKAYCPNRNDVIDYDNFIPMEVLELLEKCKENDYFEEYYVWDETSEDVDPLLVGVPPTDNYSKDYHLIARWGYALRPFEEIVEVVRERMIKEEKAEAEAKLHTAEKRVNDYLSGSFADLLA